MSGAELGETLGSTGVPCESSLISVFEPLASIDLRGSVTTFFGFSASSSALSLSDLPPNTEPRRRRGVFAFSSSDAAARNGSTHGSGLPSSNCRLLMPSSRTRTEEWISLTGTNGQLVRVARQSKLRSSIS